MTSSSPAPENPAETAQEGVHVEAETFEAAVGEAASRLGIDASELGIQVLDPGRSAASEGGFRPVRIRAWHRARSEAPDGARGAREGAEGGEGARAPRAERPGRDRGPRPDRRAAVSYGPPPPPMDPSRITPELVEETRLLTEGLVQSMGFRGRASASKTRHGIRVGVEAGENDRHLIGEDGEVLGAIQYMVARMLRARMREDAMPRIEVDVAGFRDRRNEELREIARALMDEARRTGDEAMSAPLAAAERRIIHLEVAEVPGMTTVTIGEGEFKRVVVKEGEPEEPGPSGGGH